MDCQNGLPKWLRTIASQNGLPKWLPKMASPKKGVSEWPPRLDAEPAKPKKHGRSGPAAKCETSGEIARKKSPREVRNGLGNYGAVPDARCEMGSKFRVAIWARNREMRKVCLSRRVFPINVNISILTVGLIIFRPSVARLSALRRQGHL